MASLTTRYLCLLLVFTAVNRAENPGGLPSFQAPAGLNFQELVQLAVDEAPSPPTAERLQQLLSEPFISNEAMLSGAQPIRPSIAGLGQVLRVAEWNIERGLNEAQVEMSFSPSSRIQAMTPESGLQNSARLHRIQKDLETLRGADVIILDEVDLGMKRTQYLDIARTLAQALHFNYVYGVEFVELNRLYLGEKKLDTAAPPWEQKGGEVFGVDPQRYRGLEGSAVLSRYPIRTARILRLPQCYDWFHGEMQQVSALEQAKRWSAEKIFAERVRRQVRRGGRMALMVDLAVPEAPGGQVTIVAPHLENYCPPQCRRIQMDYLLDQMKSVTNPVILGGDLNTTGRDGTPTSLRYEILKRVRSYRFWAKEALFWLIPVPFAGVIEIPLNYFKNHHDPTAFHVPLLLPNREKLLFEDTRNFRFADEGSFDFAGQKDKSVNQRGRTLAQSNQRAWKGFVPTFFFQKTYFHLIGSYKLDWFFIRPTISPAAPGQMRPFAPYNGRTLRPINTAFGPRTSDHCPITIDLPLLSPVTPVKHRP